MINESPSKMYQIILILLYFTLISVPFMVALYLTSIFMGMSFILTLSLTFNIALLITFYIVIFE